MRINEHNNNLFCSSVRHAIELMEMNNKQKAMANTELKLERNGIKIAISASIWALSFASNPDQSGYNQPLNIVIKSLMKH